MFSRLVSEKLMMAKYHVFRRRNHIKKKCDEEIMPGRDEELEQQLFQAGKKLIETPSSVVELLPVLEQIESCLLKVEQSPADSMRDAISPSQEALIADQLLGHSDVDVKVLVALCLTEIIRIVAPDEPFDDDEWKKVFQVIISAFEGLSDVSSRSYSKRILILTIFAEVRMGVIMLDVQCNELLVEMFQRFVKELKSHHPMKVEILMEKIMTTILEEISTGDISLELISPILACVRNDNEDVMPDIVMMLGERVLITCDQKLKPYLLDAAKSLEISIGDYNEVFANYICQEESGAVLKYSAHASNVFMADVNESKSSRVSLDEVAQEGNESVEEAASTEQVHHAHVSDERMADENESKSVGASLHEVAHEGKDNSPKSAMNVDTSSTTESNSLGTDKAVRETSVEGIVCSENKTDTSVEGVVSVENEKDQTGVSSENEKETGIKLSSPKAGEGESTYVVWPSSSRSVPMDSFSLSVDRPKKISEKKSNDVTTISINSEERLLKYSRDSTFLKKCAEVIRPQCDEELEQQLLQAGNKLIETLSSSVEELLPVLEQILNCLSKVKPSPSDSMRDAISPSHEALIADQLLGHSDVDVKVLVAACLSEIIKIYGPDYPYDDDKMKKIFQVIVPVFEGFSDMSNRLYDKRVLILTSIEMVKSCVIMLDLECDQLLVELFKHFVKEIRDHHPENVFTLMERVMVIVLEESDDISHELISPILACVRKDNEDVLPVARRLAERVFKICAEALEPYLLDAVKSSKISLDDYSEVVGYIWQEAIGQVEKYAADASNEHTVLDEAAQEGNKIVEEASSTEQVHPAYVSNEQTTLLDEVAQEEKEITKEEALIEQGDPANDKSPNSVVNVDTSSIAECNSLGTDKAVKETSADGVVSSENEKGTFVVGVVCSDNEKETGIKLSSPKAGEDLSTYVVSPPPSRSVPMDNFSLSVGRPKKILGKFTGKRSMRRPKKISDKTPPVIVESSNGKKKMYKCSSLQAMTELSLEDTPKMGPKRMVVTEFSIEGTPTTSPKIKAVTELCIEDTPKTNPKRNPATKFSIEDSDSPKTRPKRKLSPSSSEQSPSQKVRRGKRKLKLIESDSEDKTPLTWPSPSRSVPNESTCQSVGRSEKRSNDVTNISIDPEEKLLKYSGHSTFLKKQPDAMKRREKEVDTSNNNRNSAASKQPNAKKRRRWKRKLKYTNMPKRKKSVPKRRRVTYDGDLVGKYIKVWWQGDLQYYEGMITSYDQEARRHVVLYDDGDQETLHLKEEQWELVTRVSETNTPTSFKGDGKSSSGTTHINPTGSSSKGEESEDGNNS